MAHKWTTHHICCFPLTLVIMSLISTVHRVCCHLVSILQNNIPKKIEIQHIVPQCIPINDFFVFIFTAPAMYKKQVSHLSKLFFVQMYSNHGRHRNRLHNGAHCAAQGEISKSMRSSLKRWTMITKKLVKRELSVQFFLKTKENKLKSIKCSQTTPKSWWEIIQYL